MWVSSFTLQSISTPKSVTFCAKPMRQQSNVYCMRLLVLPRFFCGEAWLRQKLLIHAYSNNIFPSKSKSKRFLEQLAQPEETTLSGNEFHNVTILNPRTFARIPLAHDLLWSFRLCPLPLIPLSWQNIVTVNYVNANRSAHTVFTLAWCSLGVKREATIKV